MRMNSNKQYLHANMTLNYHNGVSGRITENGKVFLRKDDSQSDVYDEVEVGASLIYKIANAGKLIELSESDIIFDHNQGIRVTVYKKGSQVKIVKPDGEKIDSVLIPMNFILKVSSALQITKRVVNREEGVKEVKE